jgi:hypothetical protein
MRTKQAQFCANQPSLRTWLRTCSVEGFRHRFARWRLADFMEGEVSSQPCGLESLWLPARMSGMQRPFARQPRGYCAWTVYEYHAAEASDGSPWEGRTMMQHRTFVSTIVLLLGGGVSDRREQAESGQIHAAEGIA